MSISPFAIVEFIDEQSVGVMPKSLTVYKDEVNY